MRDVHVMVRDDITISDVIQRLMIGQSDTFIGKAIEMFLTFAVIITCVPPFTSSTYEPDTSHDHDIY